MSILDAYRAARKMLNEHDLVLVASEADPGGFNPYVRASFVSNLKQRMAEAKNKTPFFADALMERSAHSIAQVPIEADAVWLVITRGKEIPAMVVIFATPYEVVAPGVSLSEAPT